VSQFTAIVAEGLASRGFDVHVWVPRTADPAETTGAGGVSVHLLPDHFGPESRRTLADAIRPRDIVLLQYVPNALGARGANVAFCRWLLAQSRHGCDVRVVFHEPFYYFCRQSAARNALAAVQRVMAALLLRASSVAYVSTPSWEPSLRPYAPRGTAFAWVPVPAAIAPLDERAAVGRTPAGDAGQVLVGHFSSYPADVRAPLQAAVADLLCAHPRAAVLCIGRGSDEIVRNFGGASSGGRLRATGALDAAGVSRAIRACDLFVQPYPDGATARRTSLMSLLAHGAAVVTTTGANTEPLWSRDGDVVASAPAGDRRALAVEIRRLVTSRDRRTALGDQAQAFYARHFDPRNAVDALVHKGALAYPVIVGAHSHARPGADAERRQAFAKELRALSVARLINVQFAEDPHPSPDVEGVETLRTLHRDSLRASGRRGPRKPIVSEIFDVLAARAIEANARYFMYVNADVEVGPAAIQAVVSRMQDACLFARTDFGGERRPDVLRSGVDAFAFDARWWIRNRWRFRAYVLGEPTWDNVYAAIAMCHASATLVCEAGLLRHQRHATLWRESPFAEYQRLLAALDAPYFSLWCEYFERTKAVDESRLAEVSARAAEDVFQWCPTGRATALHAMRQVKARVRHLLQESSIDS
jgi:glycosyltransferase involved in cell wall biosynthesis